MYIIYYIYSILYIFYIIYIYYIYIYIILYIYIYICGLSKSDHVFGNFLLEREDNANDSEDEGLPHRLRAWCDWVKTEMDGTSCLLRLTDMFHIFCPCPVFFCFSVVPLASNHIYLWICGR